MRKILDELLKDRYFNLAVDLGCGEGMWSEILKKYSRHLIGVDHNLPRLSVAKEFGSYDELIFSEVQDYSIPVDVSAVFMIEVLEHLPKSEGLRLLNKLQTVPFVLITTPERFFKFALRNHHQSAWTEDELRGLGFRTVLSDYGLASLVIGKRIITVKGD